MTYFLLSSFEWISTPEFYPYVMMSIRVLSCRVLAIRENVCVEASFLINFIKTLLKKKTPTMEFSRVSSWILQKFLRTSVSIDHLQVNASSFVKCGLKVQTDNSWFYWDIEYVGLYLVTFKIRITSHLHSRLQIWFKLYDII